VQWHTARLTAVRGFGDRHLLDDPATDLLREITGLELERDAHARIDLAGVRSTQRLALGEVGGGIALFTWPAELKPQATYLYTGDRGARLLTAARADSWDIDARPHLAFRWARPEQRLYLNPTVGVDDYVAGWSGPDARWIGAHPRETVSGELWPWLRERGYASATDDEELEPFLERLARMRQAAHLRPALRLLRRWTPAEVATLRGEGALASDVRTAVNHLLAAVGDPPL
jgi:hypothetical protein